MEKHEIGYYAHHMGSGHITRARTLLSDNTFFNSTIFSSFKIEPTDAEKFTYQRLPEDHAYLSNFDQNKSPLPEVLHHAPLGVGEIRKRMQILSTYFYKKNPKLFISDVSAEMVQFARLCSVPAVAVRLTGHRNDLAHEQAFRSSSATLFPLPQIFEDERTPSWLRQKTFYTGGICQHQGRKIDQKTARKLLNLTKNKPIFLIVNGLYDEGNIEEELIKAAQLNPDIQFMTVGRFVQPKQELPKNLVHIGKVKDTFPYLAAADLIVGSCGTNTLLEVANVQKPFICLPEERPFEEQTSKAKPLDKYQLAVVLSQFPEAKDFKKIANEAQSRNYKKMKNFINPNAVSDTENYLKQLSKSLWA